MIRPRIPAWWWLWSALGWGLAAAYVTWPLTSVPTYACAACCAMCVAMAVVDTVQRHRHRPRHTARRTNR